MGPKLIFLVTEDWYFHMHRLPQARAARDAGFQVSVATRVVDHGDRILAEGFGLIPLKWKRGSLSPFAALKNIFEIQRVYRHKRPDIVHHVSLKSILLGTIAARLAGVRVILNAFTGLGLLFLGQSFKIKTLRFVTLPILRAAFRSPRVHAITENSDDLRTLIDINILDPARSMVIRGSGIDIDRFPLLPEPPRVPPIAACAARMLRSKGILVLAEAMRILVFRSPIQLLLAGMPDPESPDSLTDAEMRRIASEPNIEWLGRIDDVKALWQRAHIGVLPSITGEGLPVSLMEAASCGRALVSTDVAGCREIVIPGENGILVPPGDAEALADALETLAHSYDLRYEYGLASRRMVESELSAAKVGARTIQLYRQLLGTT